MAEVIRIAESAAETPTQALPQNIEAEAVLTHDEVTTLVGMGPSAHHVPVEQLRERLVRLPDPLPVPMSFVLSGYRRLE